MKRFSIILIFFTSGLFGQDNPMFDSLDYFERNKIKTIHCRANSWWYAFPFKTWEISFDKNKKTISNHSYVPRDTSDRMAMAISSAEPTNRNFKLRDTIIWAQQGDANTEIKYTYDNKKRLQKKLVINNNFPPETHYGFRYGKNDSIKASASKKFITSTNYFYADTSSNKIKRITSESPYRLGVTNFYYEKFLLSMKAELDSNKVSHDVKFGANPTTGNR